MGNLFDIAGFQLRRGITVSRLERIKREGSPPYVYTLPVTAGGSTTSIYVDSQFPTSRKYSPLDYVEIVNNDSMGLTVTINGNETYIVPSGTIRTIHGSGVALHHIGITNNGAGNTTLGDIILTLQKEPMTIDRWVQRK